MADSNQQVKIIELGLNITYIFVLQRTTSTEVSKRS